MEEFPKSTGLLVRVIASWGSILRSPYSGKLPGTLLQSMICVLERVQALIAPKLLKYFFLSLVPIGYACLT